MKSEKMKGLEGTEPIEWSLSLGQGKEDIGLLRSASRMAKRVEDVIPDLSPQS